MPLWRISKCSSYWKAKKYFKEIFKWAFYDGIIAIKVNAKEKFFPNHFLRIARTAVSFAWLAGLISPMIAGLAFIADGIGTIWFFRKKRQTKHFMQDVPRAAKATSGFLLLASKLRLLIF